MKRKLIAWGTILAAFGMLLGLSAFSRTDNLPKDRKSVCSSEHTFHDITFCLPSGK